MVRESFNPLAPEPTPIRCTVCGHEWETTAQNPICPDPVSTDISCGRSSRWEYINDDDADEANEKRREIESNQSTVEDDEPEEPEEPEPDEPTDDQPVDDDVDSNDSDDSVDSDDTADTNDTMVTKEEYDRAHNPAPDDEDDNKVTTGIPAPNFSSETIALVVIAAIAIIGLWWVMNRRSSSNETQPDATFTAQEESTGEQQQEAVEDFTSEPQPGDSPNRRANREIPLFE